MKKLILLSFAIIILLTILLLKSEQIYPFFNKIINSYFTEKKTEIAKNQNDIPIETDIEDLIYIPKIKNFEKIFLKKIVKDRYIKIIIPENILKLYVFDKKRKNFIVKKIYAVSVGKPRTQTPIGEGVIYTKGKIVFQYKYGEHRGNIVEYSTMLEGKKIRIPYEKMKGLYMIVNKYDRYVIHSTTEYWKIGEAVSSGCVRMLIDDMLDLYPYIKPVMKVKIEYKLFKLDDDLLTIYDDVYHRSINLYKDLIIFFQSKGINPLIFSQEKIRHLLFSDLPITVSLNDILDDCFIAKKLNWNEIKLDDVEILKKNKISFINEFRLNEQ